MSTKLINSTKETMPTQPGVIDIKPFSYIIPLTKVWFSGANYLNGGSGEVTKQIGELYIKGEALLNLREDGTTYKTSQFVRFIFNGTEVTDLLEHFGLLQEMKELAQSHIEANLFVNTGKAA